MSRDRYHSKTKESYQEGHVMCGRKAQFSHERVKKMSHIRNQRFYECPYCGFYHLTKKEKL